MSLKSEKILKYAKKIRAIELLGGCCIECGVDNIHKLCFHHINRNDKKFDISDKLGLKWNKIKDEVIKCELLCLNCHTEKHYNEISDKKDIKRRSEKKLFISIKGDSCEYCNYNKCDATLEFHHHNDNKNFSIGKKRLTKNNLLLFIEEINKCTLLCKNCHIHLHKDSFYDDNKDEIIKKKNDYIDLNKIDLDKFFELYNGGYKQVEISKLLNCSKSRISELVSKYFKGKNTQVI